VTSVYQTLALPSPVLEILSFSQKSPDDLPMSPTASRRGIRPPSSLLILAGAPYHGSSGAYPKIWVACPSADPCLYPPILGSSCMLVVVQMLSQRHAPVDLKTGILGGKGLCQRDQECLADAICVFPETSLGFLILCNKRL